MEDTGTTLAYNMIDSIMSELETNLNKAIPLLNETSTVQKNLLKYDKEMRNVWKENNLERYNKIEELCKNIDTLIFKVKQ